MVLPCSRLAVLLATVHELDALLECLCVEEPIRMRTNRSAYSIVAHSRSTDPWNAKYNWRVENAACGINVMSR